MRRARALQAGVIWLVVPAALSTSCMAPQAPATAAALGPGRSPVRTASCERAPQLQPLVTEWPASEKAHLESVRARQPVAVRYDGCELTILDECRLPGVYTWNPQPLLSEVIEITSADELDAALPLGGSRLEGELERSGELVIRTTVAGRFDLQAPGLAVSDLGPCSEATHVVAGMNVGAFSLVSAGRGQRAAQLDGPLLETKAAARRTEHLLREAGIVESCGAASDQTPNEQAPSGSAPARQCSSPIRLFLQPLQRAPMTRLERAQKFGEVHVHIPLAHNDPTPWTLHSADGKAVCTLPCTHWMPPASGYYLKRSDRAAGEPELIPITAGFPVVPGAAAQATYTPERGSPALSRVAFWALGAPALVMGGFFTLAEVADLSSLESHEREYGRLVFALSLSAVGAGLALWHRYSVEASFEVTPLPEPSPVVQVRVGVGYVRGRF